MDLSNTLFLPVGLILISNLIVGCQCGPLNYVFAYNELEKSEVVADDIKTTHEIKIVTKGDMLVKNEVFEETFVYETRENTLPKKKLDSHKEKEATSSEGTHTRHVSDVDNMSVEELVRELHRIVAATPNDVVKGLGYVQTF